MYKVTGIKKTIAFLMAKKIKINIDTKKGIKTAGEFLKEEVISSIDGKRAEERSVDTGDFKNSVSLTVSNDKATVSSDVDYSKSLEYGTSKTKARRHFHNSLDRNKTKIVKIIKDNI